MPESSTIGLRPSDARVIRTLKNGYWDHTEVIELKDGSQRVRKRSKGATGPGPWSVRSLRREIRYLATLPEQARSAFPPVLHAWDNGSMDAPDVGYEMPFYAEHQDVGMIAVDPRMNQREIDSFQDELARIVVGRLHVRETPDEPLSHHIIRVVREALADLQQDPLLAPLIAAPQIELNGRPAEGPLAAFHRIERTTDALAALDSGSSVRLHGDFFLENILWRHVPVAGEQPRLVLIDPVSVAGVFAGPAVFDLVKYESYAKGELLALRSEWLEVAGFEAPQLRKYDYRIIWDEPGLERFRNRDWLSRFRSAFELAHGPTDDRAYRLIDGYFSVAMAVNTTGKQRWARLLKATSEFNAVLGT